MRNIIIVDIDGTIAKVGDRLKYLQQTPKDWDSFYEACDEDEPIESIIELIGDLLDMGNEVIFCTGRRESVREKTCQWIEEHLGFYPMEDELLMRPDGDHRHDTEVKVELIKKAGIADRIWFILEDRNSMVAKWRELGFTCLQPADGNF